jgi:7-cyano-7-deazaguanine synthase
MNAIAQILSIAQQQQTTTHIMIPKTIVHLLSGGLDSTTMLYDLKGQGHNVHCMLVDYRQKHVQELTFAKQHCHRLGVLFSTITIPPLGGLEDDNWIVPNRNAIMLSLAVNLAAQINADTVTIGCNKTDEANFPDCRMAFIQLFNTMLTTAEIHVEVCAPYLDKPKAWIAGMARELGVDTSMIWTCYKGGAVPCGECPACQKLTEAMQ